jgi:GH24 family phage-related lysozyme (muramidase)
LAGNKALLSRDPITGGWIRPVYGYYNDGACAPPGSPCGPEGRSGNCTRGWGHLVHRHECKEEDLEIAYSYVDAENELTRDIQDGVNAVVGLLEDAGLTQLTEGQFAALVDVLYHRGNGPDGRAEVMKIIAKLAAGDIRGALLEIYNNGVKEDFERKLIEQTLLAQCHYAAR